MRQVIAIGGGGFGRTQASNLIEKYILDQAIIKALPVFALFLQLQEI